MHNRHRRVGRCGGVWRKLLLAALLSIVAVSAAAGAQLPSLFIEDLTWTEVRDAIASGKTTALYLAGSTEEGGPHMILGKHNQIARFAARRIAEELGNALVYPVMPFAPTGDPLKKDDLMEFPGSVSVSDDTFGAVAKEVALSAIAAGFRNVILMGEHGGGQHALERVAAQLNSQWSEKGTHVYYADGADTDRQLIQYCKDHGLTVGEHADVKDTSKLLYIDTQRRWVRKGMIAPGGEWSKTGVDGNPTEASVALGRSFMDIEVRVWVDQIRALIAQRDSRASVAAASSNTTDHEAEAIVLELDRAWGQAYVKGDIDFVDRILAPDWRGWTDHKGSDKESELAEFRAGNSKSLENIIDNARVRVFGDTAVVEARERVRYRDDTGEHWLTWHITDVLVRNGGQWHFVTSHQSTLPNL